MADPSISAMALTRAELFVRNWTAASRTNATKEDLAAQRADLVT